MTRIEVEVFNPTAAPDYNSVPIHARRVHHTGRVLCRDHDNSSAVDVSSLESLPAPSLAHVNRKEAIRTRT